MLYLRSDNTVCYLPSNLVCARDTCRFETKALAEAEIEPRRPPHD